MAEEKKEKKKVSLGDRMRAAIMRGTNADKIVAGMEGKEPAGYGQPTAASRRIAAKVGTPRLSPRRDPANMTNGIFDETKYERNQAKKKR